MRNILTVMSALAVASSPAFALESVTTGSQATQATVGAINSKVDVTNNFINSMMKCNAARKFYAPSDPKKDSDGCVGVGDYDLNMASGNNVNLADGRVYGTQTGANNWAGLFYGPASSNYGGVYGQGGVYGVYGLATGSGGGAVVGESTSGWSGVFKGANSVGVSISNNSNNAQLCLNGKCTTSFPSAPATNVRAASASAWRWPAAAVGCASNEIVTGGGGSCTSGSGDMRITNSIPHGNGWYVACDTSLNQYATAVVYAMCLVK